MENRRDTGGPRQRPAGLPLPEYGERIDPKEAGTEETLDRSEIGRRGGEAVSRDRQHMADIGRRGGQSVSQNRDHMSSIGRKGGQTVSQNREHMASIGRRGGLARGQQLNKRPEPSQTDAEGQGEASA